MNTDVRQAAAGRRIPHGGRYADQPFLLRADDGAWLCALTTSPGHEGVRGQHVETFRSRDRGVSWEGPTRVEPEAAPENSYSVLLKAPGGRIFIFYNFNTENRREVLTCDGPPHRRVDSLGDYVFKFSDDHGRSWSPRHYRIPARAFRCDLENPYGGAVRFF